MEFFIWMDNIRSNKKLLNFLEKILFEEYLLDVPEKVILYSPDVEEIISY